LMEDSYLDDSDFAFHVVSGVSQIKLQWVLDTLSHKMGWRLHASNARR
jgi:hypothetical protein